MSKKTNYLSAIFTLILFLSSGCSGKTSQDDKEKEANKQKQTKTNKKVAAEEKEDMGKKPWVLNIEKSTINNDEYRHVRWTGKNMQMVLMSLKPGELIDLELHPNIDQFIRIEKGKARVLMGKKKDKLDFDKTISDDWAILIPAGYWHKIENIGSSKLKVYTLYTPPSHEKGTLHKTYKEAAEHHHDH
ncbi:MAG: cupin domain-containing protein [Myxococcota bacterium]